MRTQLRPPRFASYKAASALCSMLPRVSAASCVVATPILMVIRCSTSHGNVSMRITSARKRSAISTARSPSVSGRIAMNSSPPILPR